MINNKKIIITGGSSGLGLALAKRLASGNTVARVARNAQKLEEAAQEIPKLHPLAKVYTYSIDVASEHGGTELSSAAEEMGGLDLLINSAGILREGYFVMQTSGIH